MAKQIILAVAGAGKTYYICHELNPIKKNLILAFTRENISNIKRELIDAYGNIPELTSVMTFDSFIYRYIICPYEPSILQHFGRQNFISHGVTLADPPAKSIRNGKRYLPNPHYISKKNWGHYINQWKQYYCANLAELIMQVKCGRTSLIKRAAKSINMFYDQVMIDEFQDFREHNYELIIALSKQIDNILLVGDFYQHSVSATNNSGKPFKKGKNDVNIDDFKQELIGKKFNIDETTLKQSRRCCKNVCDYVKKKLQIDITSCSNTTGNVLWITKNAEAILDNPLIVKLVYSNAVKYNFNAVNWSYSKGDTMEDVCVILTDEFKNINVETFNPETIPLSTRNKLYVAMTRSKKNLYIIEADIFNLLKNKYKKPF